MVTKQDFFFVAVVKKTQKKHAVKFIDNCTRIKWQQNIFFVFLLHFIKKSTIILLKKIHLYLYTHHSVTDPGFFPAFSKKKRTKKTSNSILRLLDKSKKII